MRQRLISYLLREQLIRIFLCFTIATYAACKKDKSTMGEQFEILDPCSDNENSNFSFIVSIPCQSDNNDNLSLLVQESKSYKQAQGNQNDNYQDESVLREDYVVFDQGQIGGRGTDENITCKLLNGSDGIRRIYQYQDLDGDGYFVKLPNPKSICVAKNLPAQFSNIRWLYLDCNDQDPHAWQFLNYSFVDNDGDGFTVSKKGKVCSSHQLKAGYFGQEGNADCDDKDSEKFTFLNLYQDTDGDGVGAGSLKRICSDGIAAEGYSSKTGDHFIDDPIRHSFGRKEQYKNLRVLNTTRDERGYLYITGHFSRPVIIGETTYHPQGGMDGFVLKLTARFDVVWFYPFGSKSNELGKAVAITNDALYVTGGFSGSFKFGHNTLTAQGYIDSFVAKLALDGSLVWGKSIGSKANKDIGLNIVTVFEDQVIIMGNVTDKKGSYKLESGYIKALSSSGDVLWDEAFKGESNVHLSSITDGKDDHLYITGAFKGLVNLLDQEIRSKGKFDVFVLKLSYQGELVWCKSMGGKEDDKPEAIILAHDDHLLLTGYFNGTITLDQSVLTSKGNEDIFLLSLSKDGQIEWVNQFGTKATDVARAIASDESGHIYIAGYGFKQIARVTVFKTNQFGKVWWRKQLGDEKTTIESLILQPGGKLVASGYTNIDHSLTVHSQKENKMKKTADFAGYILSL